MEKETRSFVVEIRSEEQTANKIVGYANKFDNETIIANVFREKVAKGAFKRALDEKHDVRALFNHDANIVLGRSKSNTLRMVEDDIGLRVEIDIPDTSIGKDLKVLLERGDVNQMSFAFIPTKESWVNEDRGQLPLRVIEDLDLYDVSVVTYPAYEDTEASVRNFEARKKQQESEYVKIASESRKRKLKILENDI